MKVKNQQELDTACKQQQKDSSLVIEIYSPADVWLVLWESSHAELWESSHAELRGSSHAVLRGSSHAELWGSSHAELWGSSHAELRGSSHAVLRESSHAVLRESSHAELWESSHAELRESSHAELRGSSHAELWESSHAELWGSSHAVLRESSHAVLRESSHAVARNYSVVKASTQASITIHGETPSVTGGIQIKYVPPTTAAAWCEDHGVQVIDGVAILFKGVNKDYSSNGHQQSSVGVKKVFYTPGTAPVAEDWDGGKKECGYGLHFSPTPRHAKQFHTEAERWVACPVALVDIVVHPDGDYPEKIKASKVCAPIWEVAIDGNKLLG